MHCAIILTVVSFFSKSNVNGLDCYDCSNVFSNTSYSPKSFAVGCGDPFDPTGLNITTCSTLRYNPACYKYKAWTPTGIVVTRGCRQGGPGPGGPGFIAPCNKFYTGPGLSMYVEDCNCGPAGLCNSDEIKGQYYFNFVIVLLIYAFCNLV